MWTCHSVKILGQRGLNFCHLASRIAHKFCLDALARICLAGLIAGNRQQWRQAWRKALMITTVTFAYFLLIFSCMMSLPPCSVSPCSKISTSKSSSTGTYLRLEPRFINFHTICPFDSMFKTVRDLVRLIIIFQGGLLPHVVQCNQPRHLGLLLSKMGYFWMQHLASQKFSCWKRSCASPPSPGWSSCPNLLMLPSWSL